jgi:mono/diheme cytochrome c family protein
MRAKTLGVFLITLFALFTALYWITDENRRDTAYENLQEELIEYGKIVFGPASTEYPATANCAQCHGANGEGGQVGDTGRQAPNLHGRQIVDKLKANPEYVNLVIRFGGVVASGDVNSPMPAWSDEVGGALTKEQVDAVTALVESWAAETAAQPVEDIPDTVEAGQQVFSASGCGGCHGADLAGTDIAPSLLNIGNEPVTGADLPTPLSAQDQLVADYEADPRAMLEKWIRDSATNYNDGTATGMQPFPEGTISESALRALITFLLDQKQ